MREDTPLREITTEELYLQVQQLRSDLETHTHLGTGSQPLNGIITGDLQSGSYKVGSSGWILRQNGTAELQELVIASGSIGATDLNTTIISGGKIITGLLTASNIQTGTLNASLVSVTNLNADNITAGTITGRQLRTSASGARIEINNPDYLNEIAFYNSSNVWTGGLFLSSGILRVGCSPSGSGSAVEFNAYMNIISSQDVIFTILDTAYCLRPLTTGVGSLGESSHKWRKLYLSGNAYIGTGSATLDGTTNTANLSVNKNFVPSADNSYTCGSSGLRWSDLRSVLINGADYGFENNWWITESYKIGIEEEGLAVLNSKDELVCFIGENGLYAKDIRDIKNLTYIKRNVEERKKYENPKKDSI